MPGNLFPGLGSALDAGCGDSLHEELLGKHEEDDDREGQEEHAGQSEIFLLEMLVVHRLQPHHQHELLQGGDEGGGNQVRVPGAGKIENRYGGDEHARNGQHNAHIGAEPAQAV